VHYNKALVSSLILYLCQKNNCPVTSDVLATLLWYLESQNVEVSLSSASWTVKFSQSEAMKTVYRQSGGQRNVYSSDTYSAVRYGGIVRMKRMLDSPCNDELSKVLLPEDWPHNVEIKGVTGLESPYLLSIENHLLPKDERNPSWWCWYCARSDFFLQDSLGQSVIDKNYDDFHNDVLQPLKVCVWKRRIKEEAVDVPIDLINMIISYAHEKPCPSRWWKLMPLRYCSLNSVSW
ncbi:MAG: hypothetical protein WBQ73_01390, partial [Candidatus Babeliales bacterium]